MARIRRRPSLRPARYVLVSSACLLALVGLARGIGSAHAPTPSAWAPTSSAFNPTSDRIGEPVGTAPRDAWRADWADRCIVPADAGGRVDAAPSRQARELLELVRTVHREADLGAPLLAAAWDRGAAICLDDRPEGLLGAYDLDHGLVFLNERLTSPQRAVVLVHELRHVEATARGFRPSLAYAMSDTVALRLALEADAQAVATLYAWKTAELGDAEAWSALYSLDRHANVAAAFEQDVVATGSVWSATQSAFARWFESPERVDAYHRNACLAYLDALDASKATQSYQPLPPGALDGLGRLPGGRDYAPRPPGEAWPAGDDAAHGTSPPCPLAP